jgi:hypothetical protein
VQANAGSPFYGVLDALRPPCLTANILQNEDHEKILVSRCAAIGRTDRE